MAGDPKKAMEDYNLGLEMNEDYPYLYLMLGELKLKDGDKEGAETDFAEVLRRDTVANDNSCRMYALHFLGKEKEAEEWMDRIIADDPDDAGRYYDQACLYSRMSRPEESIKALRTALEKGYRGFAHIRLDDDMDSVRDIPEFKSIIEEYESRHKEYLKEFELAEPEGDCRQAQPGRHFRDPLRHQRASAPDDLRHRGIRCHHFFGGSKLHVQERLSVGEGH